MTGARAWIRTLTPRTAEIAAAAVKRWEAAGLPEGLQAYVRQRAAQVRASTLRLEESLWKRYCRWVGRDPGAKWPVGTVTRRRPIVALNPQEVEAMCTDGPEWLARYVRLATWTGLRLRTLRALRPEHVVDGILHVPPEVTKSYTPAAIAVPAEVREWLPLKLPKSSAGIWRAFRKAAKAAGIQQAVCPRDLRSTWVVLMAEAGASLEEIAAIGGWRTLDVLRRHYFVVRPQRLRELARRLNGCQDRNRRE